MNSQERSKSKSTAEFQDLRIEILSWPLKDEPVRAVVILVSSLLLGCLVALKSANFWLGLLGFTALQLAFWRLWIPVAFSVSPVGIEWTVFRKKRRIPWLSIRRYEIQEDGFLLLPTANTTPIYLLKGLFIPWCGRREDITAIVEQFAARYATAITAESSLQPSEISQEPSTFKQETE